MTKQIKQIYETFSDTIYNRSDIKDDYFWLYLANLLTTNFGEKPIRVLDIGAGEGRYSIAVAKHFNAQVIACDLIEKSFDYKNVKYKQCSMDELVFGRNEFDLVILMSSIFYSKNQERLLEQVANSLHPGGIVVITTHTYWSLYTVLRRLKRFLGARSAAHLRGADIKPISFYTRTMGNLGASFLDSDGWFFDLFGEKLYVLNTLVQGLFRLPSSLISRVPRINRFLRTHFSYHCILVYRKHDTS